MSFRLSEAVSSRETILLGGEFGCARIGVIVPVFFVRSRTIMLYVQRTMMAWYGMTESNHGFGMVGYAELLVLLVQHHRLRSWLSLSGSRGKD